MELALDPGDPEGCMGREQSSETSCLSERFPIPIRASTVCVPAFVRAFFFVIKRMFRLLLIWLGRPPDSFLSAEKITLSSWFCVSGLLVACFVRIGVAGGVWTLCLTEGSALLSRAMSLWIPFVDCRDKHTRKKRSLEAAKFSIILSFNLLRGKISC